MARSLAKLAMLSCAVLAAACLAAGRPLGASSVIFVSPNGDDRNDGSRAHPVATLQAAQRLARSQKAQGSVTVSIDPGLYLLTKGGGPLRFGPEDSGTAQAPVAYVGAGPAGSVIVSGAAAVAGWTKQGNNIWTAPLPAEATGNVYSFFVNGSRQTPSRTPTEQYVSSSVQSIQLKPGTIKTQPHNPTDIRVVLYETWTASVHPVTSIDVAKREVNFLNHFDTEWASASGDRFYLENMLEALDTPGEFYIDSRARTVTWLAPAGQDPNSMDTYVPVLTELVQVFGALETSSFVEYLTFENLSFMHTEANYTSCYATACNDQSGNFLTEAAIHVRGGANIEFTGVSIAHVGSYGLWFEQGSFNNTLSHSHLYDLGGGAVRLGVPPAAQGAGDQYRTEGNVVSDNVLEDGGHVIMEGCGVLAQSVAHSLITHNIITNFFYTGVSLGWTWGYANTRTHDNIVSYNAINIIGKNELSDMGGVYTLGTNPGTFVENNIVHSVYSYGYGGWAYYTDEGSTNYTYRNNIAYDIKCAGHHQHYGMDNLITNNVYANVNTGNCDSGVRSSMHAGHTVNCLHINPAAGEDQGQCSSLKLFTNIVNPAVGDTLVSTVPYGFLNSTVDSNVHWSPTQRPLAFPTNISRDTSFAKWQQIGRDVHGTVADPLFAKGLADQFSSLQPSSPALARGFKPIDISTVGPRSAARIPGDLTPARFAELQRGMLAAPGTPVRVLSAVERAEYEEAFLRNRVLSRRPRL